MLLVENPQTDIRSFSITMSHSAGTKRGQGKGSFVGSVTALVDRFYSEVMLNLKSWSAPPPRPKAPPKEDAQEVDPPMLEDPPDSAQPVEAAATDGARKQPSP
jgi:hypothetical protein